MPFSELISRRDLYKKRVRRAQIIGFVIYFIGNAILPPETWFKPGFHPIGPTAPAAYYTMFFLFFGVIAFFIWNSRRIACKLGLSCPQCHQIFAKEHLMAHTVASGKCPRCAAEIISEHPSTRADDTSPAYASTS